MVWLIGMVVTAGLAGLVVLMRAERVRILHTSSSSDRPDASVSSATSQG